MTELNELKSWIEHAEDDFESAKVLIQSRKPLTTGACFHAQQCAENIRNFSRKFLGLK